MAASQSPHITSLTLSSQLSPVALQGVLVFHRWNEFYSLVLNDFAGQACPGPLPAYMISPVAPRHI